MPKAQLVELYARGLGVIDEARLSFGPRFNVITGETGAGKTLLLGALELCLGGEGSSSRYAVTSETKAAALFDDGGQERLFIRESTATGRLRSTLDSAPASADALRSAARDLIAIHGQHDSLTLRTRAEVVRVVDAFGGIDTTALDALRDEIRHLERRRQELGGDAETREREMARLAYERDEIERAAISGPDELRDALERLAELTALRDSQATLLQVIERFDGDDEGAVLSSFAGLVAQLPSGDSVADVREQLRRSLEDARDAVRQLQRLTNPDAFDEEAMSALADRISVLQQLVRKYGHSLEDVLHHFESATDALQRLSGAADELSTIDDALTDAQRREREESRRVRREREFASVNLTNELRKQLPRVSLPNASLRFDIDGLDGSDAQILFTPNPGQPEGPLQALASGGELSRVLLALSLATGQTDMVAVFDEVDAGVGGQVAQHSGACLSEFGERQQVIAVTHLASVAARAQDHFVIEKSVEGARTVTTVRQVTGVEREREIARMLTGDATNTESLALARRLLEAPDQSPTTLW
jgi:DNA repair protein RecN (Recombination protein N)